MAMQVCTEVTSKLKFLYRKNRFLSKDLRRLLCNALIQPHFDYACAAWYPNLNKKYKNKLQVLQNKCISFCLQLDNRQHIGIEHFDKISWLPIDQRCKQCLSKILFWNVFSKALSQQCLSCLSFYLEWFTSFYSWNYNTNRNVALIIFPCF